MGIKGIKAGTKGIKAGMEGYFYGYREGKIVLFSQITEVGEIKARYLSVNQSVAKA